VHRNSGCLVQAIPAAVDHSRTRPAAKVPEAAAERPLKINWDMVMNSQSGTHIHC
jgi:hypothetical protein